MKRSKKDFSLAVFARSMQLPDDYSRGNVLITMQGQEHISIENFKGISSYTENEIRIITKEKRICITGKKLKIDCYSRDEIEISGIICKIEYC